MKRKVFWLDFSGDVSLNEAFLTEEEVKELSEKTDVFFDENEACAAVARMRELREEEWMEEEGLL